MMNYISDSDIINVFIDQMFDEARKSAARTRAAMPMVDHIIANEPATIVFWADGSKTVVKQQPGDGVYDVEKGFAMALIKHLMGDKGNYNNYIKDALSTVVEPKKSKEIAKLPSGLDASDISELILEQQGGIV